MQPLYWLTAEATLVLFFIINGYMVTRKITSASSKRDDVIDVQGEVVEERHKLK